VRLFVQLGGAALAGRAARWAAACCGWLCACLVVCGGRSARPTGSSAAQGAGMRSALHVRLCARLARMFPCDEGRAYFVHAAGAGGRGGRRGLTAVRRRLVFGVTRAGTQEALPPSRCREGNNARALSGAGKRTAASGVAWSG